MNEEEKEKLKAEIAARNEFNEWHTKDLGYNEYPFNEKKQESIERNSKKAISAMYNWAKENYKTGGVDKDTCKRIINLATKYGVVEPKHKHDTSK